MSCGPQLPSGRGCVVIATLAVLLLGAPPTVTAVNPSPLPLGSTAEVLGAGFVDGSTTVTVGGIEQGVANVQPTRIVMTASSETPLGSQTLVVATPEGDASLEISVVGRAPIIDSVEPEPLVLGATATIVGEALAEVVAVDVGGVAATIVDQTDFVVVIAVPSDAALAGSQVLSVIADSSSATRAIEVVPPMPVITSIAPNPARQGDLVTVRGAIVPLNVTAQIGTMSASVVGVSDGVVELLVDASVPVGPHQVVVQVGTQSSLPEGPLYIEAADPERPVVDAVYPSNATAGGDLWIGGDHLDQIDSVTAGLELSACDRRACRLGTAGVAVGVPVTAAVSGPTGADAFTFQVNPGELTVPVIEDTAPSPARRGEELTISGTGFERAKSVVIGGRAQSIQFFDTTTIRVQVHPLTPLGAELLFVAGDAGSLPATVTVLEPASTGEDVTDGDSSTGDVEADASADGGGGTAGGGSGGCRGAGAGPWWLLGLLVVGRWWRASSVAGRCEI